MDNDGDSSSESDDEREEYYTEHSVRRKRSVGATSDTFNTFARWVVDAAASVARLAARHRRPAVCLCSCIAVVACTVSVTRVLLTLSRS